jgi:uncharacterized protein (DUF433 family)
MQLPDFLSQAPDGEIRLTGHRIGLSHLVDHYNEGESAEMLACRYPTIPLALVHKVLAFYLENQADVDAYVAASATTMDEAERNAQKLNWDVLSRRLGARPPSLPEAQVR